MLKLLTQNTKLQVLLVIAAAFITFFPTLENYFYLDEWGNLYEWTHGYPYKYSMYTVMVFRFLFDNFGLNPTGYYAAGLATYIISAVIFYFLASRLLNNKLLGLIAGIIYATSPVGINTSTMVWTYVCEGGYPLTIMLLTLLYILLSYLKSKDIKRLLLLLFAFMLFLDLMPRRSFMFLPTLVLFDYLVMLASRKGVPLIKFIMPDFGFITRTVLLFAGFMAFYKYDVSVTKIFMTGKINLVEAASGYDSLAKIQIAKEAIFHAKPLITLTNVLLAGPWLFISERLTGYVDLADIADMRLIVISTLTVVLGLIGLAFKVKKEWGLYALFALAWIHINILGIYIFSSPGVSEVTHRTISLAAPGYALLMTIIGVSLYTFLLNKKVLAKKLLNNIFVTAFIALAGVNLLATRHVFEQFNNFHSRPAHAFFKNLKTYAPALPKDSLIYFDVPPNAQIKYKLSRIYGGNNYGAASTIAAYYPGLTMKELQVVFDYPIVEKFVEEDKAKIDRVFAFHFDDNGLTDITNQVREQLKEVKPKK